MTKPTDAEIVALMRDGYNCRYNDEADHIDFARAVLARWGTPPAEAGEPVAWLDPWTGTKVTTDYDAYGKHGIPLYKAPQPTQAQAGAVPVPLTDEQKHARNPYRHSRGAASIWLAGFAAAELWYRIGIKGGQHGADETGA